MTGPSDADDPRIDTLHGVALDLARCQSETAVYDAAIAGSHELFDVKQVVVMLRRDDRWVSITHPDRTTGTPPLPITGTMVETTIEREETVTVEAIGEVAGEHHPFADGTALCVPFGDKGILQLIGRDVFDDEAVQYVELLSFLASARLAQLSLSDEVDVIGDRFDALTSFHRDALERASHELRTPLTSIIGYMELVLEEDVGTLGEDQEELLKFVYRKATELEAAVETLTTTFDDALDVALEDAANSTRLGALVGSGSILLIESKSDVTPLLADRLRATGYRVRIAESAAEAEVAITEEPPAVLVMDWFVGDENGLALARRLNERCNEELPVALLSIVADESNGESQLGVSAVTDGDFDTAMTVGKHFIDMERCDDVDLLVVGSVESHGNEDRSSAVDVTQVVGREAAIEAHCERGYDFAIVAATGDARTDCKTVAALRERRCGRRMPVVLVDPDAGGTWYTVGGRLFVQRPLNVTDLTAALISACPGPHDLRSPDQQTGGLT
ncbi:PAS/PAC sensor signal transduction histidine kinase [Natronococcus amylolyticus DSM 10524]|uniref:PAS/PAC sensor signal transduction histidine kinase n=1 Tax=Natronococcus amylolyticus DSM 10524 TaxID=1227497 RepID=L9X3G4_9EURY|nr:histidine kinase dimerization/phospho-acceptor domain-containing protein [Natronococcus amylolyticus]ELY55991.1 PAS/PAC sensor signal transduction histidine kinase [Natronococcus amylolyticus DSM 10524]